MHDFGFFGGGWMMFFWWFFLIAIVVILIRSLTNYNGKKNSQEPDSPLDILKKRYARGEIEKEEFEKRKQDLL